MAEAEITIQELGPQGDGIGDGPEGKVYVERALPGEKVRARLRREETLTRGEIVGILAASSDRQVPPCPLYDRCGGCTLQHMKEEAYRRWKVATVETALAKQGQRPKQWLEPIFLGGKSRRRATFSVRRQGINLIMGYYRRRSREINDIEECLIADPKLLALRETLKPFLIRLVPEGTTVDIFLQLVGDAVDMVITGAVGRQPTPDRAVRQILEEILILSPVSRIGWRPSELAPIQPMQEKDEVIAQLGQLKVVLPPDAFLQPTLEGEKAVVDAVMAVLPSKGVFADLFSGCGTFAGNLLSRGPVDAYESSRAAVAALAKASGGRQLKVIERDLFAKPLNKEELTKYSAVVFDPPRAGCVEQAMAMAPSSVPLLIGISCNPATFARDARYLTSGGYRLESVQVIDQFLWSHHVEVVGVFSKGNP